MGVNPMRYGYARVSSKAQDYEAQVEALKAAGCERIFSEKASGKSTDGRPEFGKLLKAVLPGDTIVVTKLDRLARSSRDLHNILHELMGLSCGFVSLGESWCDTTSDVGMLVMTIMGGIAEFERKLIRKRTEEGIERAKRKGTKFGRKARLDDGEKRKIAERYAKGETIEQLAEEYECGIATIWRSLQSETQEAA
jgi:DNA invertase Pin-like site-specific DNA recombinase